MARRRRRGRQPVSKGRRLAEEDERTPRRATRARDAERLSHTVARVHKRFRPRRALHFAPLAQRLADQHEFVCIEWPQHGDSGADRQPASAARYATLIGGAWPSVGIDRPIILGNSIGGAVGILHAARNPVRGLVLCDSGGLVEVTPTIARFCRTFARFFAAGERGAWWYPYAFAAYYKLVLPEPAAARQRSRIVARATGIAPVLRQAWTSFAAPEADIRAVAAGLDVPVWVAWAKRDRVIPLRACRAAIDAMRNATLDTFDAGHSAFLEQPDEFARGFVDFVARLADALAEDEFADLGLRALAVENALAQIIDALRNP